MLLKFNVSGIGIRTLVNAKLRLYCVDGAPFGGEFHRVTDTTWTEGTVNWNNAPAADASVLSSLGKVSAGSWYEVDVTSLVNGDGAFSVRINSTSTDGAYYSTKEGTAGFAPQLVVTTTGAAPTLTPTPTVTDTPTSTPGSQNAIIFSDGFESGTLSQWTSGQGLAVQRQDVASGSYAAQGTSQAGGATYARKSLAAPQIDLHYRIRFKLISQGTNTLNLMKLRTSSNASILSISINNLGNLSYRNDVAGASINSLVAVSPGNWHTLQVHARVADTMGQVEVWYDDVLVNALSRTEALGTNPVGILQLGENTSGLTYNIAFDDVVSFISNAAPTSTLTPTFTPTASSVLTFTMSADTYVQSDLPASNFGSSPQFVVDNNPIRNTLLKFNVSGIGTRTVVSAKLRIYCIDPSPFGGAFYRVDDSTWSEGTVTWNTVPTANANSLATLGAVAAGNWYEVDLTSLISGDGTFSLKMSSTSTDGAYYSSKEGANAPQLVIQTSP
jgi:hypothetical protein